MPRRDFDFEPAGLSFDPVPWEHDEGESGARDLLDEEHFRLLRRLAAGDNLFLLLESTGKPSYDFGPDEPVPVEPVKRLIDLKAIVFHGAPGALVAMRARLTALGRALISRRPRG